MMSEKFYNWLNRKYGIGDTTYKQIELSDPEWAESLVREFSSIVTSY